MNYEANMKRMNPQPPEETAKVQQIGGTDSFDCLGFGEDAPNFIMLAVVHRPIGSTVRPVCKGGVWYWSNARSGTVGAIVRPSSREGLSSDCALDPMIIMAILMGGREHPCDRCNIDRSVCRGYPRL